MATTTVPGVRATIADGFFAAADVVTEPYADRVLIVGRAAEGVTGGWQAGTPTNVLYNPTLYRSESDLVTDFGSGSDVHVAYLAALKGGASQIYVSATDPNPSTAVDSDVEGVYDAMTVEEYDLYRGLEHAERANPSMIVVAGYYANEYVDAATDRISYAAKILVDRCKQLTDDVGPCFGVISLVPLKEHYELKNSAVLSAESLSQIGSTKSYQAASEHRNWGRIIGNISFTDNNVAVPVADIESIDYVNGIVTFTSGHTVAGAVKVTCRTLGTYPGLYSTEDVKDYVDDIKGTAGTPASVGMPYPIQSAIDLVDATTMDDDDRGLSKFLVVTAGEVEMLDQPVSGYQAAAAAVTGSIYSTPLDQAITLRPLNNAINVAYDMTKAQKLEFIQKGVVPIALSPSGLITTVDGITLAIDDDNGGTSVYSRLSSVRIVHEVTRGTRGVLEPFIGSQASTERLNSIETKLRGYYMAIKQNGLAKEIRFEMRYSISESKLTVYVTVIPFGEIREVDITVDVQLQ